MRIFLFQIFITFTLFSQVNIKYAETITEEDLKNHIEILASDEFEGREPGKKGQ